MKRTTMLAGVVLVGGCRGYYEPLPPDPEVSAADTDAKQAMTRWERAELEARTSAADAQAAIEKVRLHDEKLQAAEAERTLYANTLAEARDAAGNGCKLTRTRLVEVHRVLLEYASDPRRDAAIAGLEPCRKAAVKLWTADLARDAASMRGEIALSLEQVFDAQNPDLRGHLIATVKRDTLEIAMPKIQDWDAPRSQREVEAWCASIPNFTAIVLKNPFGTFKCSAKLPPRQYAAQRLADAGLADPWSTPPSGAKSPPPGPTEAELAEKDRLGRDMTAAIARMDAAMAALASATQEAQSAVDHNEAVRSR